MVAEQGIVFVARWWRGVSYEDSEFCRKVGVKD